VRSLRRAACSGVPAVELVSAASISLKRVRPFASSCSIWTKALVRSCRGVVLGVVLLLSDILAPFCL